MSSENNNISSAGGIVFTGVLTIVFIVLKLTGVIQWSWLWVLSPVWISVLIILALILFIVILKALGL